MKISLVICTRNRAAPLQRCLDAVLPLAADPDWELVLVDNGSTDGTATTIAAFAAAAPFVVRAIVEPEKGLSNARNAGVAAATGDIILFTDDDCYPAPGLLAATRTAFAADAIGFVTGRVALFDRADAPITINESMVPLSFPARRFLATGQVKGANLAFRRKALEAITPPGGVPFDPILGAGARFPAGEDSDAAQRIALAGWEGAYVPEMLVYHHHGRRSGDVTDLIRAYDLGRGAFHAKLLLEKGGLRAAAAAWGGLPIRIKARPGVVSGELKGALGYWWARLSS